MSQSTSPLLMNKIEASPQTIRDAVALVAAELGFSAIGVCSPYLDQGETLRHWVESGAHAEMRWMERHVEARMNPELVLPGVRSIIMMRYEYASHNDRVQTGRVARYAQGEDYHLVLKSKLADLDECMQIYGGVQRCFSDSGPVSERFFAQQAGLGWIGKNGMIIHEKRGSYAVLASILTTLDLPKDQPAKSRCGNCRRCLDACPTGALDGKVCDARRCLSYWTIEAKEALPDNVVRARVEGEWLFGCDACQEVCPWNASRHRSGLRCDARFRMSSRLRHLSLEELRDMDDVALTTALKASPLRRAGADKLRSGLS